MARPGLTGARGRFPRFLVGVCTERAESLVKVARGVATTRTVSDLRLTEALDHAEVLDATEYLAAPGWWVRHRLGGAYDSGMR
ncbi:hypothetical protein [Streptomyces sp. NPDC047990]|uniref:hypothetical protein n=1 Tax=Streptomyces sp. NPDC047990 TaxID=3365496 RepID=UPI00371ADEFA